MIPDRKKTANPLPPRPPLPKIKYRYETEHQPRTDTRFNDERPRRRNRRARFEEPYAEPPVRERSWFRRFIWFLVKLGILAGLIFFGVWAVTQPFAAPYIERLAELARRAIEAVRGMFG